MEKPARQPPYFLLSFIPAVAYWLLETYSTLEIALIGGMILGLIEMSAEKWFTGHVHTLSKVNIFLIVVLGAISLYAKEGVWFKLQPTFTGIGISGFLFFKKIKGHSLLLDMLKDLKQTPPLPEFLYLKMEWHLTLFLVGFAAFMAKVAIYNTTDSWIFWKTAGFYLAFGGFLFVEMFYIRHLMRRKLQ